jgi:hypothetical protein
MAERFSASGADLLFIIERSSFTGVKNRLMR